MTERAGLETMLATAWPVAHWQEETVLIAVSGGTDSVALLRGLAALKTTGGGRLVVAHVNHGLRQDESDADEAFVLSLCQRLKIPCETTRIDVAQRAASEGDGIEAAARKARYEFLTQTAEKLAARYVATAHTADDQIETLLMRIFRGTGISGLSGIPRDRALSEAVTLIRPLLSVRRRELVDYLTRLDQPYREDSSNQDVRHRRNWIRHELLPRLTSEYDEHAADAVLRLGRLATEAQDVIDHVTQRLADKAVTATSDGVEIDCAKIAGESSYVVRELLLSAWRSTGWPLQSMGYTQWERLAELTLKNIGHGETIRQTYPGKIMATRTGDRLCLTRGEHA